MRERKEGQIKEKALFQTGKGLFEWSYKIKIIELFLVYDHHFLAGEVAITHVDLEDVHT